MENNCSNNPKDKLFLKTSKKMTIQQKNRQKGVFKKIPKCPIKLLKSSVALVIKKMQVKFRLPLYKLT